MSVIVKKRVDPNLMEKLCLYLEEGMGLHYTRDRWPDLEKKMNAVINELGYKDLTEGIQGLLQQYLNDELIKTLAYHLTIGETYFFRDTSRMEILEKEVLPDIIQRHSHDKKIKIWSAACCTGEEPYSVAILLDRLIPYKEDWDISIIGTDINKEFLNKAELANYKKWSFRATPQETRAKYFTEHKERFFTLIPKIKKMVTFAYSNILENNESLEFHDFDLILCHNVLIYFSPKQINKTIHLLTKALASDSWLSISSIETPFVNEPFLKIRNFAGAVFFKKTEEIENLETFFGKIQAPKKLPIKEDESLLKVVFPDFIKMERPVIQFPFSVKDMEFVEKKIETINLQPASLHDAIDYDVLYQQKKYREIVTVLNSVKKTIDFLKNDVPKVLLLIRTYANLGELTEGLDLCREALKIHKLDPNLHCIHATICMALGENQEAIKSFKSTLFIEPNYVAAHYMLGTLEHKEKNYKASRKSFRRALELLELFDPDEELLGAEELTAARAKDLIENTLRKTI
jgi:chemotaxis protein methyltransferase CheR